MKRDCRTILVLVSLVTSFKSYGVSERELQQFDRFSFPAPMSNNTLNRVFIDLNTLSVPKHENTTPLSTKEYRNQLKQQFAYQLNPKWQVGLDSFKACPIDKQAIDWPKSTEPKENRSATQRGFGVGVRMKLD